VPGVPFLINGYSFCLFLESDLEASRPYDWGKVEVTVRDFPFFFFPEKGGGDTESL
ncbi:hypothetical protein Tco_0075932, partial [Tanacetum coccineum]